MGTRIKIVIGVVVFVVLAVVVITLLTGDDDDKSKSAGDKTTKSADKGGDKKSGSGASGEPALRTLKVARSSDKNAAVNVGAIMHTPGEVWLRVSAAPKQEVRVNWTLACGIGATAQGDYDVTPPDTHQLKLPKKNPKTCVASASSQIDGKGRLKLAILRDR